MGNDEIERRWLELFCFMTTSARALVGEPAMYGPFRLIHSLEKIIDILEMGGACSAFLKREKEKIAAGKLVLMTDRDAFIRFMDEIVIDFTKELKNTTTE